MVKSLKGRLPRISETERAALEAGTVWVDGELFSGRPDLRRMLAESYPRLTPEEQAFLDGPVAEVCRLVDPEGVARTRELTPKVWRFLKEHGFFGLCLPQEHGGLGFSSLAASAIFAKLVSRSMYLSTVVVIPNSVGPGELLLEYGTPEQKERYLPRLARGEEIPCFALTEPEAGSDAASLSSKGVVFERDGALHLHLTWNKRYITLAPVATLLGLACRIEDPQELLGLGPAPGITCVLVPASAPGVEIGRRHDPMGLAFPNGPIRGKNVEVPLEAVIGGREGVGKGWRMLMEALSGGRAISLPAQAAGGAKWVARVTGAYATVRRQFGLPIGRFEGIQEPLARIAGRAYLMEAARAYTCGAVDAGERPSVVSAVMKYNLTELARETVTDGMDVLGGAAICKGPHNLMADAHIGSPIGITVEGANILTRSLITFGQGALRCHPYARKEMEALAAGDTGGLLKALAGHGFFFLRNAVRSFALGLTRGRLARSPVSGPTAPYFRKLSWASARFALLTDLALAAHGAGLKRRGQLTGRYADALSWMFLGFAALRRFEAEGRPAEDLPLVRWSAETALSRVQSAFERITRNFEAPVFGFFLRTLGRGWLVLAPLGRGPKDDLVRRAADRLRRSGAGRERLTGGLFLEGPGIERLERAFAATIEAEPFFLRLQAATRQGLLDDPALEGRLGQAVAREILSREEADLLLRAEELRQEAIHVDEMEPDEYLGQGTGSSPPLRASQA